MRNRTLQIGTLTAVVVLLSACGGDPNSPGVEYMPDMYRSPAMEAYLDHGQDPYYFDDAVVKAQRERQSARKPVAGTVPFSMDPAKAAFNFPYPYPNTPDGYEQAGLELKSPIPMIQENVDKGKVLYDRFCLHCHGPKGQGDGAVVKNGNYPQPPAYDGAQLAGLSEGKMFHSLMYGKNVAMGSHAGQLDREERWLVVQYVKYLQAGGRMPSGGNTGMAAAAPVDTLNAQ
ncbi:MAG: cytochrome c [Flavobacteriales bacterium]|nr:cytochrome c [Flavobacteriales bacterium]